MEALFNAIEASSSSPIHLPRTSQEQNAAVSRDTAIHFSNNHNGDGAGSGKGGHACHICGRTYERGDHLSRHLKTHENARPYKCRLCPKRFNRADLLNRHQLNHSNASARKRDATDRVSVACLACVASKCKCQNQKPCARCQKKNIPCETGPDQSHAHDGTQIISTAFTQHQTRRGLDVGHVDDPSQTAAAPVACRTIPGDVGREQPLHSQETRDDLGQHYVVDTVLYDAGPVMPMGNGSANFEEGFQQYPFSINDFQFHDANLGFIPRDSYFGNEIDLSSWQFDPSEFEMHSNDDLGTIPSTDDNRHKSSTEEDVINSALKRYAAFERSPWLWNPTPNDHALCDETNLNVEDSMPLLLTQNTGAANLAQFSSCCIDSTKRDQILHMLFSLRVRHKEIRSFPPLSLLNLAIRVFFVQARRSIDSIIHSASFSPKTALHQLLLAIISAGATSISTPSIWKMGLVFQELVRHTVAEMWEENNSYTRNIEGLQAFVISLDVGLWSGIKRTMEIAESFCQPIIVMLRRMGAFSPVKSSSASEPTAEDSDDVLQTKWETFVKRESFKRQVWHAAIQPLRSISNITWKRLVLHLFIHDTQASIGFQKPPQIAFTELSFDLPVSPTLWFAESASQWREVYLSKEPPRTPTFLEVMHNPDVLLHLENQVDIKLTTVIVIQSYWGQIWRLMESKKFYPKSKATYSLAMMTEHNELYRDLLATITKLNPLCGNDPSIALLGEFLLMVSHVSPEDLQRYAGKYGPYESKKASEDFKVWFQTSHGRMAVWHAGQVLRFAKFLAPTQLKGFNAVVVYFAVLALWMFGVMLRSEHGNQVSVGMLRTPPSNATSDGCVDISLNEAKTADFEKFQVDGQGLPGLLLPNREGVVEFIPLECTNRVLWYGGWLYKNNFLVTDEPLPPLLETLGELMRDLGSSPTSRASRMVSEEAD